MRMSLSHLMQWVIGLLSLFMHKLSCAMTSFTSYFTNQNTFNSSLIYNHSSDGMLVTDSQHKIIGVNDAYSKITGYSEAESMGHNPRFLQSGRHNKQFYERLWKSLKNTGQWQGEVWNKRKNGEVFLELLTINVIKNKSGKIMYHFGVFSDISDTDDRDEQLAHLAFHDHLTGLPNRLLLNERLNQTLIYAQRNEMSVALLFIDFDGFKAVNDTYGHDVGDSILKMAAQRMNNVKRSSDFLARVGGDEFVMIINSLSDEQTISLIAKNIIQAMHLPFHLKSQQINIGASVGVSLYPYDTTDSSELLKQADDAMYHAKSLGRNTYSFYHGNSH